MANRLALELIADANPLIKGLQQAQNSVNQFVKSSEAAGQSLGGGVNQALDLFSDLAVGGARAAGVLAGGLATVVTGAVALTVAAGREAEAIDHLSQRTGINIQTLQSWSVIMAENNLQAESLTTGMRTLSKQMIDARNPASKAAASFDEIGIAISELGSTESTIRAVADRFKEMPDGADKARLAVDLFGRSGLELIPVLNRGAKAFDESRREAIRFGLVLSTEQTQALSNADNAVDKLSEAFRGLKTQMALAFAGGVTTGINAVTEAIVKLTNFTANYSKALDEFKKEHPVLSMLTPIAPGMAAAMAAAKASQMPVPEPPPESPQGPDQTAHILAAIAAGEKQEELGRKILSQGIQKYKLVVAEGHAQEALGRVIVQMTQTRLNSLTSEEKAQEALGRSVNKIAQEEAATRNEAFGQMVMEQERVEAINEEYRKFPTSGPFIEMINQREEAVRNLTNLMPELTREQAIAMAATETAQGTALVQESITAWNHRNDVLEMAVDHAKVLDEAQQALFASERGLFGASDAMREKRMALITAEGELQRRLIEENIADEEQRASKLLQLEIDLDTKRRKAIQQFPTFFEEQMQSIQQSNVFSIGLITNTWTSGIANAIVRGGDFAKQALESTQIALLQGVLNFGVQKLAALGLQAAQETSLALASAAEAIAINHAKNVSIMADETATASATMGIWEGAATAITGTFAAIGGAIQGFFVETIIPFFVAIGKSLMVFLSAIADAMSATVFGIPYALAILTGIVVIGAAIGALAAFAFAEGGIAKGPTLGMVGEGGNSEAVIPLNKRGASFMRDVLGGTAGGGTTTVIVQLDDRQIARAVFDGMPSIMRVRGMAV